MKALKRLTSKLNKDLIDIYERDCLTAKDLTYLVCCMAGIVFIYNVSGAILNFGSDYVSDYYHLWRVEQYVELARDIAQHPNIDPEDKERNVAAFKNKAHEHNRKVRRMPKVIPEAIDTLNVEMLNPSTGLMEDRHQHNSQKATLHSKKWRADDASRTEFYAHTTEILAHSIVLA